MEAVGIELFNRWRAECTSGASAEREVSRKRKRETDRAAAVVEAARTRDVESRIGSRLGLQFKRVEASAELQARCAGFRVATRQRQFLIDEGRKVRVVGRRCEGFRAKRFVLSQKHLRANRSAHSPELRLARDRRSLRREIETRSHIAGGRFHFVVRVPLRRAFESEVAQRAGSSGQTGTRLQTAPHAVDAHFLTTGFKWNAVVEVTLAIDDAGRQRGADVTQTGGAIPRSGIGVGLYHAATGPVRRLIAQRTADSRCKMLTERNVHGAAADCAWRDGFRLPIEESTDASRDRSRDIAGDHVHHSTNCCVAVQQRSRPTNHFDALSAVRISDKGMVCGSGREIGNAFTVLQRQDPLAGEAADDRDVRDRSIEAHRDAGLAGERLCDRRPELSLQVLATELDGGLRDAQRVRASRTRGDLDTRQPQHRLPQHNPNRRQVAASRHRHHLVRRRVAEVHDGQMDCADRGADERELAVTVGYRDAL